MEQQIQDLIASIKKDGIEEAEKQSKKIIEDAKAQAASIIKKAESDRDELIALAKKDIELERSSSEAAIKQAARDVSLSLKKSIEKEFSNILNSALEESLHGEVLVKVLEGVIKAEVQNKDVYCYLKMILLHLKVHSLLSSRKRSKQAWSSRLLNLSHQA